jgi:hypothetical protein
MCLFPVATKPLSMVVLTVITLLSVRIVVKAPMMLLLVQQQVSVIYFRGVLLQGMHYRFVLRLGVFLRMMTSVP